MLHCLQLINGPSKWLIKGTIKLRNSAFSRPWTSHFLDCGSVKELDRGELSTGRICVHKRYDTVWASLLALRFCSTSILSEVWPTISWSHRLSILQIYQYIPLQVNFEATQILGIHPPCAFFVHDTPKWLWDFVILDKKITCSCNCWGSPLSCTRLYIREPCQITQV